MTRTVRTSSVRAGAGLVLCSALSAPPAVAQIEAWTLERELVIGDAMSLDRGLTRVGAVASLAEYVYVGQPQERLVRVFSPNGDPAGVIGRAGRGPGEFERVGRLGRVNGLTWVSDPQLRRVSYFDSDHAYVSSVTIRSHPSIADVLVRPVAVLGNRSILALPQLSARALSSGKLRHAPLLLFGANGELQDTVATLEASYYTARISAGVGGNRSMYVRAPVIDATLQAAAPDGSGFVLVYRAAATEPSQHTYRVVRFGANADTVFARDLAYEPIPISSSYLDRRVDTLLSDLGDSESIVNRQAFRHAVRDAFSVLDYFPAVERVLAGRAGTIWLERRLGEGLFEWEVLSPDGEPLGRFSAPDEVRLVAGDLEGAWFVETDDLDIPYLVRYSFVGND